MGEDHPLAHIVGGQVALKEILEAHHLVVEIKLEAEAVLRHLAVQAHQGQEVLAIQVQLQEAQ